MGKNNFYDAMQPCVTAIDGTSASGKGTIASMIANRFSFIHCQTSIFYRSLALEVINKKISTQDVDSIIELSKTFDVSSSRNNSILYSADVTNISSVIASIPKVRKNLYSVQRDFLLQNRRVVMEGRDIGTVIAPDADIKIYITADLKVRALRRFNQMLKNGQSAIFQDVMNSLEERDARDKTRSCAPLAIASDAIVIDSSNINAEEVLLKILSIIDY